MATSLVDIIKNSQSKTLVDEDGEEIALDLLPPLSGAEIDHFANTLPCALPEDVRELLLFCRGFEGVVAESRQHVWVLSPDVKQAIIMDIIDEAFVRRTTRTKQFIEEFGHRVTLLYNHGRPLVSVCNHRTRRCKNLPQNWIRPGT